MRVHFVVHESFESAGAYLKWAEDRGYTISWSRVYAGEALPPNADEFDMLVVFGGPQSPRTTREECPYFDSRAEQHLINQAITARRMVIGICLGSQLIGEALGAKVRKKRLVTTLLRSLKPVCGIRLSPTLAPR